MFERFIFQFRGDLQTAFQMSVTALRPFWRNPKTRKTIRIHDLFLKVRPLPSPFHHTPSMNLRNSSSLSLVNEVCSTRPLPANGLSPSRTLSGVDLRTSTNSAEQPDVRVAPRSRMN